jgi:hypothetical protein
MSKNKPAQAEKKTPEKTETNTETPANAERPKRQLTADEEALVARISKGGADWENITEESMLDFSLANDKYALPPEALKKQNDKEFAFRFIAKTSTRIDEIQSQPPPATWWVCNRTRAPFLAKYCDPLHGGIQREDQILVMKPWALHQRYQDAKAGIAQAKDKAGDLSTKDGKTKNIHSGEVQYSAGAKAKLGDRDETFFEESE